MLARLPCRHSRPPDHALAASGREAAFRGAPARPGDRGRGPVPSPGWRPGESRPSGRIRHAIASLIRRPGDGVAEAAEAGGGDALDFAEAVGDALGQRGARRAPFDFHPAALGQLVDGRCEVVGREARFLQQRRDALRSAAAAQAGEDPERRFREGRGSRGFFGHDHTYIARGARG